MTSNRVKNLSNDNFGHRLYCSSYNYFSFKKFLYKIIEKNDIDRN